MRIAVCLALALLVLPACVTPFYQGALAAGATCSGAGAPGARDAVQQTLNTMRTHHPMQLVQCYLPEQRPFVQSAIQALENTGARISFRGDARIGKVRTIGKGRAVVQLLGSIQECAAGKGFGQCTRFHITGRDRDAYTMRSGKRWYVSLSQ